ncbi:MAG: 6-phosphogluconolactonase [Phycisphaerae bacterium]|nr:6-phosphogluconolactonase [Gemmatimonadaceae bacterium]
MTQQERVKTGTRESIAAELAERLVELAEAAVAARGVFTLAIPGGSAAEVCLPALANAGLPWGAVHIFWVDERAVPITHRDSNAGQAMALWKGTRLAAEAVLHPMPANQPGLERAATQYSAEITSMVGFPAEFDAVIVGVGEDGHVASLFPHHRELSRTDVSALAVSDSPKAPARRLTVSLSVLTGARDTFVVAFGKGKAGVIRQALETPNSHLPVALVVRGARQVSVMLDAEAAGALADRPVASG